MPRQIYPTLKKVYMPILVGGFIMALIPGCRFFENWENPFALSDRKEYKIIVEPLETRQVEWSGWSAIEQGNGLLTLRHVPAAGGRTLSCMIHEDDVFWVNDQWRGQRRPADAQETGIDFGGNYLAIGPQRSWSLQQQPFNPNAGPWQAEIENQDALSHTVRMTSRPGTLRGATVEMERSITMHRGNTHVRIEQKATNRGPDSIDFLLRTVTEIDGLRRRTADQPLRRLSFFFPVPLLDGVKKYRPILSLQTQTGTHFDASLPEDVLAVHYGGQAVQVISDSRKGWIAAVDRQSGWTFIKTLDALESAGYVDQHGPIELATGAMDRAQNLAVNRMELLGGFQRCRPGADIAQIEHWYAAVCQGPILAVTSVGAACEPLALRQEKEYIDVSGRFAVFYRGLARLAVLDHRDRELFVGEPIPIDPRQELLINATLPVKDKADVVVLRIHDYLDEPVGELAREHLRMVGR
ncbi:MAG: hypothetical protein GXY44_09790 [Phycisphaerales bacterium]|nr:hypothetical protein [Phycisphaerales bacterium]